MHGASERLRVHLLIRAMIPLLGLALCLPMIFAHLDGRSEPTSDVVASCSVIAGLGWWLLSGRFRLVVDDSGVRRETPFGDRALRWDEIVDYRYTSLSRAQLAHMGAAVAVAVGTLDGGTLRLRSDDGRALPIGSAWRRSGAAIERVAARLDGARRQQLAPALRDGSPITFGRVTVQRDGLVCGERERLPWSDLAGVSVTEGRLRVKRHGQRRAYFAVRTKELPFLFLLLQLLADKGVQIVRD